MSSADVGAAYSRRAVEYTELLGNIESTHQADRLLIASWAESMDGLVVDAGCGPGQWTKFLKDRGISIEGVDLVPDFIAQARKRFPGVPFQIGALDAIGFADSSVAGILAWYSIIHMPPSEVASVFREFSRCITPGGGLLLGFFEGAVIETFPHVVTPAYFWPVDELTRELAAVGFEILERHGRVDGGHRPHAAIVARRTG